MLALPMHLSRTHLSLTPCLLASGSFPTTCCPPTRSPSLLASLPHALSSLKPSQFACCSHLSHRAHRIPPLHLTSTLLALFSLADSPYAYSQLTVPVACILPCMCTLTPPPSPPLPSLPHLQALAPMLAPALLRVVTALLLEQKVFVVSHDASALAPFIHALTSLLFPLRWRHIFVPVLPPSHAAVASAPFPFVLGIPAHPESWEALGRSPPHADGKSALVTGELWVMLDTGR